MIFKRSEYLNKLIARKHNVLIKLVTGTRRAGKNFLLNELFYLYLLNDGFKKFLITKNGFKPTKDDFGVTTMDLFEFLLDEESLNKE